MVYIPQKPRDWTPEGVRETLKEVFAWKPSLRSKYDVLIAWSEGKLPPDQLTQLKKHQLKGQVTDLKLRVKQMVYAARIEQAKLEEKKREARRKRKEKAEAELEKRRKERQKAIPKEVGTLIEGIKTRLEKLERWCNEGRTTDDKKKIPKDSGNR